MISTRIGIRAGAVFGGADAAESFGGVGGGCLEGQGVKGQKSGSLEAWAYLTVASGQRGGVIDDNGVYKR